jgi:hypothetical protein
MWQWYITSSSCNRLMWFIESVNTGKLVVVPMTCLQCAFVYCLLWPLNLQCALLFFTFLEIWNLTLRRSTFCSPNQYFHCFNDPKPLHSSQQQTEADSVKSMVPIYHFISQFPCWFSACTAGHLKNIIKARSFWENEISLILNSQIFYFLENLLPSKFSINL